MKVPYIDKKIKEEFQMYLDELEESVIDRVALLKEEPGARKIFSKMYPLFVLLRGLTNSDHVRDITRDIVLSELQASGQKSDFLEALRYFNRNQPHRATLVKGTQKLMFTGYFEELFSDGLLVLNSYYAYNYRGVFIAIRCMLEDLYRHLYYLDHQQEFWDLNRGDPWDDLKHGIQPIILRSYLETTSYLSVFREIRAKDFKKKEKKKKGEGEEMDLFGLNEQLYAKCSGFVHASSVSTFGALKSNAELAPNSERAEQAVKTTDDFVCMGVAFLVAAHIGQFMAFGEYERSMVLGAFSRVQGAEFRRVLNI